MDIILNLLLEKFNNKYWHIYNKILFYSFKDFYVLPTSIIQGNKHYFWIFIVSTRRKLKEEELKNIFKNRLKDSIWDTDIISEIHIGNILKISQLDILKDNRVFVTGNLERISYGYGRYKACLFNSKIYRDLEERKKHPLFFLKFKYENCCPLDSSNIRYRELSKDEIKNKKKNCKEIFILDLVEEIYNLRTDLRDGLLTINPAIPIMGEWIYKYNFYIY